MQKAMRALQLQDEDAALPAAIAASLREQAKFDSELADIEQVRQGGGSGGDGGVEWEDHCIKPQGLRKPDLSVCLAFVRVCLGSGGHKLKNQSTRLVCKATI